MRGTYEDMKKYILKKYFPGKYLMDGYLYCKKKACILLMMLLISSAVAGCGSTEETEALSSAVTEKEDGGQEVSGDVDDIQGKDNLEGAGDVSGTEADGLGDAEGQTGATNTASDAANADSDTVHGTGDGEQDDAAAQDDDEDSEIIARRDPVKVRGIYVSGPVAGIAKMDTLIDLVDQTELNAMVIDIKNDEGKVTYKMQSEQVLEIDAGVSYIKDIDELVSKCKEKDIYLIARIVSFRDPYLAEQKPEWAVHTKDGEIFRDKSGLAWVNPYKREVWDYLVEIASQAGEAGFDEVQFDYIRFSTDIKEEEVDYGEESENVDKIEIITEFTEYMYDKLVPQGIYVAADVFGTVIDKETDQEIVGQDYVQMAQHLDYICPMVYPSHYYSGSYGISVPDAEPYNTIYAAASASAQELEAVPESDRAHVRPWIQGFTASWVPGHISYGREQIRAQIKGAYDAGYDEWIVWNAAVNYQPEAFLSDEEAEAERQQWDAERVEAEVQEKDIENQGTEKQQETVSGNE